MPFREWYQRRGPRFVVERGAQLARRYGFGPGRSLARIQDCVAALAGEGAAATFFVPGVVVERYPQLVRCLEDMGAETAVHGYAHVDLRTYPPEAARDQLLRAVDTYIRMGIRPHGFRCPYLSCNAGLLAAIPPGAFRYSSNQTVTWNAAPVAADRGNTIFRTLSRFYSPESAQARLCTPFAHGTLLEIPVCVPDDLQLVEGLGLDGQQVAEEWQRTLQRTHARGELFTLVFHTELADSCLGPLVHLARAAGELHPGIWIARLRDIAEWWLEKREFAVETSGDGQGSRLSFRCSDRATVLLRELPSISDVEPWDGRYARLKGRTLTLPAGVRPFVGVAPGAPEGLLAFLRDQGYVLDTGAEAAGCTVYLDAATSAGAADEVALIERIEGSAGPLVRYGRWPNGGKSALSITADLDALTLVDYAARVLNR